MCPEVLQVPCSVTQWKSQLCLSPEHSYWGTPGAPRLPGLHKKKEAGLRLILPKIETNIVYDSWKKKIPSTSLLIHFTYCPCGQVFL